MRIGLVGGSNQSRSLSWNAERTVNLIPFRDPRAKEEWALLGTPGLTDFAEFGGGPVREAFTAANGRCFFISENKLVEVTSDGTETERGTLNSSGSICTMDENGLQLGICDGTDVYIFTYATDVFAEVTDVDLPTTCGAISFLGGYFFVNSVDTGKFYISALYDGTSWNALDFSTAESKPDILVRSIRALGYMWNLGSEGGEVWSHTGNSSFPFEKIGGGDFDIGCAAAYSVVVIDGAIIWVGKDKFGSLVVYSANSFTPEIISTDAINYRLQTEVTTAAVLRAWAYQEDGHVYYVLTGGGMETSLVYDRNTKEWHERAFLNGDGNYETHLGACCTFAFGKHLVGSRVDGKLYEMRMDLYSDAGEEIARERIYTHLIDEGKRFRVNELEIGIESGVGDPDGDDDPIMTLSLSSDGGRTYGTEYSESFGEQGEYNKKLRFRRLGTHDELTIKIRTASRVKVALTGSYIR
jgi:hypothetical protein